MGGGGSAPHRPAPSPRRNLQSPYSSRRPRRQVPTEERGPRPTGRSARPLPITHARGLDFDQDLVTREGAGIWEVDQRDSAAELADAGGPHQRDAVWAWAASAMKGPIRPGIASAKTVNTASVYPRCRVAKL